MDATNDATPEVEAPVKHENGKNPSCVKSGTSILTDKNPPPLWMEACNVVFLVNTSHLDRLKEYLTTTTFCWNMNESTMILVKVLGIMDVNEKRRRRKNVKLLVVRVEPVKGQEGATSKCDNNNDEETTSTATTCIRNFAAEAAACLVQELSQTNYLAPALNKCFIVDQSVTVGAIGGDHADEDESSTHDELNRQIVEFLNQKASAIGNDSTAAAAMPTEEHEQQQQPQLRVRVQSFPTPLASMIANAIDSQNEDDQNKDESLIVLDPVHFTHLLSVVRISPTTYLVGLSPSEISKHMRNLNVREGKMGLKRTASMIEKNDRSNNICRAFYKLQEACCRYPRLRVLVESMPSTVQDDMLQPQIDFTTDVPLHGLSAIDVGAAPGGWTKFLLQEGCANVVAVDPSPLEIVCDDRVQHLRATIKDALPSLVDNGHYAFDVYVSDMCLPVMENQLEWMLKVKEANLLKPNALFCLTLKCVVGHSQMRHDTMVETLVKDQLLRTNTAYGVQTLHLFNNRNGERTIMGYLR